MSVMAATVIILMVIGDLMDDLIDFLDDRDEA
jgi:hypothetical protein